MRILLVALVVSGCGPYGSSRVGRTCDAGAHVQACSSPTTYEACDKSTGFAVWREYPCREACAEGKTCDVTASKPGDACSPSWKGVTVCRAPKLAISCVGGAWAALTCAECPEGTSCFACSCESAASLQGKPCEPSSGDVCEVDGQLTRCINGVWWMLKCSACRAGQTPANCGPTGCSCN